uniref:bile acid-CoA:amino acid N-acyltransferase-like isoform X1 n=1 Tax=Styela clava TaxID=7725 RepID=UPI00193A781F|nr:bile acid-CoA:amino acid N-acyltransferase-like isoform X1 [Styela clava]XP_039252291.1 bile acid-CoA:amino acid N-acyltransferase-like isoform X2 [Styela clava]
MLARRSRYLTRQVLNSCLLVRSIRNASHGYIGTANVSVDKKTSLADEAVSVSISGLKAFQKITLHAFSRLQSGSIFESFSHYIADESGCIILNQHPSHGGNFEGIDGMGPISHLVSSPLSKRKYERFMIKEPKTPFTVDFRTYDNFCHSLESIADQGLAKNPTNLSIERTYMSPNVQEISIWEGRVRATLYLPEGNGPFPGVISMSGGFPGAMKFKAALLASRGFAALALKYFGEDDLPKVYTSGDIGYIEEACILLQSHPKVDGRNGVGIIANCFGGLIGLATASVVPENLVRCVTTINGWPFILEKFRYGDEKWSTSKNFKKTVNVDKDGLIQWYFDYKPAAKEGIIDIHDSDIFQFYRRRNTSYMFVVAEDDTYVSSELALKHLRRKLEQSGHPDCEILFYPKAGHLIEYSYHPHTDVAWTLGEPHKVGGVQPHHAKAQQDSWPKILDFTYERLVGRPRPRR